MDGSFLVAVILRLVEAALLGIMLEVVVLVRGFWVRIFWSAFLLSEPGSSPGASLPSTIAGFTGVLPPDDPGATAAEAAPPVNYYVIMNNYVFFSILMQI